MDRLQSKDQVRIPFISHNISTRGRIIGMGSKKHPRPYQRSRGGKNLFQIIQILMTTTSRHTKANCKCFVNLDNIITIGTNQPLNRSVFYNAGLINFRSVVKKIADVKVELSDHNLHVFALTETWLKEGDDMTQNQLCLKGYTIASMPRVDRAGGGIALIYKSDIKLKAKKVYSYTSMECAELIICLPTTLINLCIIYQPPNTSILDFCNDLTDYFEKNITSMGEKIIFDDFNQPTYAPGYDHLQGYIRWTKFYWPCWFWYTLHGKYTRHYFNYTRVHPGQTTTSSSLR